VVLPSPFDGLGFNVNLTLTDSSVTLFARTDRLPFFKQAELPAFALRTAPAAGAPARFRVGFGSCLRVQSLKDPPAVYSTAGGCHRRRTDEFDVLSVRGQGESDSGDGGCVGASHLLRQVRSDERDRQVNTSGFAQPEVRHGRQSGKPRAGIGEGSSGSVRNYLNSFGTGRLFEKPRDGIREGLPGNRRSCLDVIWVTRFNAADADGLAALYADSATNHQATQSPIEGKKAIREMFA